MRNVRVCRICPLDAVKPSIGFKPTATVAARWKTPRHGENSNLVFSPCQSQAGLLIEEDKKEQEEK